jgi:hypothetical protein
MSAKLFKSYDDRTSSVASAELRRPRIRLGEDMDDSHVSFYFWSEVAGMDVAGIRFGAEAPMLPDLLPHAEAVVIHFGADGFVDDVAYSQGAELR